MDPTLLPTSLLILRDVLSLLGVCFNVVRYISPMKLLSESRDTAQKYRSTSGSRHSPTDASPTAAHPIPASPSADRPSIGHLPPSKAQYKATQQLSGMPYVCQNASSFFWLTYAFMNHITSLLLINMFGAIMSAYYMYLYYQITKNKRGYLVRVLLGQALFISSIFLLRYQINVNQMELDTALKWWGFAATCITIINFGSPLSTLRTVLKTKDSESIPLHLTLANLCGALTWTLYGILRFDRFIVLPNCIGSMLSILNVTVKYVYRQEKMADYGHTVTLL